MFLVLVDDGSSDNTHEVLSATAAAFPKNVKVLSLPKNQGKAGAVQTGMLWAQKNTSAECFAYLDADLSPALKNAFVCQRN